MEMDLIYDIGCNNGDDTDFYLRKGFRVVAIDADESLCNDVAARFSQQVADGKLVVINGLIANTDVQIASFYRFPDRPDWNTGDPYFKRRNENLGLVCEEINVPVVSVNQLFRMYGVPYYMKVDIEGLDIIPIKSIEEDVANLPAYVSIEVAHHDICAALDQLATLRRCGYSKFLFFNQGMRNHVRAPNPPREGRYAKFNPDQATTGMFGRELDGRWLDIYGAAKRLAEICRLHALFRDDPRYSRRGRFGGTLRSKFYNRLRRHLLSDPVCWYDLHATIRI
jgi:FkbM family methyltransferase